MPVPEPKVRLGFNAYYGLEKIAFTTTEFESVLEERVDICLETNFLFGTPDNDTNKIYGDVLLADTFFSDTFPSKLLGNLVRSTDSLNLSSSKDE